MVEDGEEKGGWRSSIQQQLGVQIEYDVVHIRTSLVQLFVLLLQMRFGGAPNDYPFAALATAPSWLHHCQWVLIALLLDSSCQK
jgi:hypothetical protein